MAEEDQRAAREADVAGGDRREAERGEGSNDSRHEQMDSCICSEGIRFLEAAQSPRAQSRDELLSGTGEGLSGLRPVRPPPHDPTCRSSSSAGSAPMRGALAARSVLDSDGELSEFFCSEAAHTLSYTLSLLDPLPL